jgi:hypothetical protein
VSHLRFFLPEPVTLCPATTCHGPCDNLPVKNTIVTCDNLPHPCVCLRAGPTRSFSPYSWGLCACALSSFKIFYLHLGLPFGQPCGLHDLDACGHLISFKNFSHLRTYAFDRSFLLKIK